MSKLTRHHIMYYLDEFIKADIAQKIISGPIMGVAKIAIIALAYINIIFLTN